MTFSDVLRHFEDRRNVHCMSVECSGSHPSCYFFVPTQFLRAKNAGALWKKHALITTIVLAKIISPNALYFADFAHAICASSYRAKMRGFCRFPSFLRPINRCCLEQSFLDVLVPWSVVLLFLCLLILLKPLKPEYSDF